MAIQYTTMERLVGIFILAIALMFLGSIALVGKAQNWFADYNYYTTTFAHAYDFSVGGTKVKMLNRVIGQVTKLELTETPPLRPKRVEKTTALPRRRPQNLTEVMDQAAETASQATETAVEATETAAEATAQLAAQAAGEVTGATDQAAEAAPSPEAAAKADQAAETAANATGAVTQTVASDEEGHLWIKVHFRVLEGDAKYIGPDSVASVASGILGGSSITLTPGTPDQQEHMVGKGTPDDAMVIPSEEPLSIMEKIDAVVEGIKEGGNIEHKLLMVDDILYNVNLILEHVESLTYELQSDQGRLLGTLANVESVTHDIAEGKGSVGKILLDDAIFNELMSKLKQLDGILGSVQATLDSTKNLSEGVSREIPAIVTDVRAQVPQILTQVQSILNKVDLISANINDASNDVPEISDETRQSMRKVNDILESVKQNFLIRGNLPASPEPESHNLEYRGN